MVGIDEVGRGCWAGPLLVVAARRVEALPKGLKDSKQLSRMQREAIFEELLISCQFGEGWVTSDEIDKNGLAKALRIGVSRSLKALAVRNDEQIVMDGQVNYMPKEYINIQCVVGADSSVPIVSCASIYAKVLRDRHMIKIAKTYPEYGFEKHVGYGTTTHVEALRQFGAIDGLHRKSYKPVKKIIEVVG